MLDKNRNSLIEIEGTFTDGVTMEYEIEEDEKIIGIYGVYNYQPYIVGLSFILWSSKPNYTTENEDTIWKFNITFLTFILSNTI